MALALYQTRVKPGAALQTLLSFTDSLTLVSQSSFVKISLWRRHTITVGDGAFSYKIDYVTHFESTSKASKSHHWFCNFAEWVDLAFLHFLSIEISISEIQHDSTNKTELKTTAQI